MARFQQNADAAESILRRDSEYLLPVYARFPVVMERGEGVHLFDTSGNRYLDMMAGLGVNALGHAHPRMVAATADQASEDHPPVAAVLHALRRRTAERLCALSGMAGCLLLHRRSRGGRGCVEAGACLCAAELLRIGSFAWSRCSAAITAAPTDRDVCDRAGQVSR